MVSPKVKTFYLFESQINVLSLSGENYVFTIIFRERGSFIEFKFITLNKLGNTHLHELDQKTRGKFCGFCNLKY